MYPELFSIGNFTIHTYGVFMALAVICGYLLLLKTAGLRGLSEKFISYLFTGAVIWGFIGARLFYVLIDLETFIRRPLQVFFVWSGGLVFSGALIGGIGWAVYAAVKRGINFLDIADVTVPPLALGYAIARIGCFMAGCCYGTPTETICGVVFPRGSLVHHDHVSQGLAGISELPLPVHPVQLYSIVAAGIIAFILYRALKSPRMKRGSIFAFYLVLYGAFRVAIEFLRGDFRGTYILFFTPTQWVAAIAVATGLYILLKLREEKNTSS